MSKAESKVTVKSNWIQAKQEIEAKGHELLIMVAFFIEQQFKLRVTDLSLIDTGFYRNSAYVSGLGITTYGQGSGQGARRKQIKDKTGKLVWRERAERAYPSQSKNAIVIGVAAAYAYWLEQTGHAFMFALEAAKREFGGKGVDIQITPVKGLS